ncbi:hypothetical protein ACU6VG_02370 [Sphaerotilus sulfidivorans]|jgi:hypothetical protein|uniref:hypothetical protein n=1 Tax=Sphaerotilus sp. FB-3 TaxID=2913396 RepID=UPI00203D562F|nr:hypothetical protein [Sphaerotilus sp. FB-3]GKQ57395.1 hypothetical protein QMTAC487_12540 [Sphaerotilus sp. FB-3]
MNILFYDSARNFLEKMIQENPSNSELVKAYSSLMSKFADIEMKYYEHNTDYNKNHDKNQAELAKNFQSAQAEITKKQIDKGVSPVAYGQLSGPAR